MSAAKTATLVLVLMLSGCVVRGSGAYVVDLTPPPPRATVVVESRPGWVWVDGRWGWASSRWVWYDGYWEAQRPGHVYVQGTWVARGGRHHWVPGRWHKGKPGHRQGHDRGRKGHGKVRVHPH